jgi:CRP/FNR family transcriptional regulator, cyclic AMP receptor protein
VIALLAAGDFLGEGRISSGAPVRMATATTMVRRALAKIKKDDMIRVLHEQKEFAGRFISCMLRRNVRIEADLLDQLFNSTEKRWARALLLLARYGRKGQFEIVGKYHKRWPNWWGDAQSRQCFHNKFGERGFIRYNGGLPVRRSLVNVVLHD